jgi:hypothetical protein
MADEFKLESEMPGFQTPQQTSEGGGGQGLLNVLGAIGSGLLTGLGALGEGATRFSAGVQAGRGNVGPLMMLRQRDLMQQQEQQRQNLLGQLQTFAEQADPDVKDLIQNQLKFGQPEAALKTAANASTFTQFKRGLETSRLSPGLKKTISNTYLTNPGKAADMLRSLEIVESQMGAAKQKEELQRERSESKTIVRLMQEGFRKGFLNAGDPNFADQALAYLQGYNKKVTPEDIKVMMVNPELAAEFKNMPVGGWQAFANRAFELIGLSQKPKTPQQPQAPAPAPAAPQQPSAVRKFNPATGRLE